jgi:hypothetical protein
MSLSQAPFSGGWQLDRRVSAAFVVTVVAQVGAMVWFLAAQHATLNDHDRRIPALELAIRDIDRVGEAHWTEITERLAHLEDGQDEVKRVLGIVVMSRARAARP